MGVLEAVDDFVTKMKKKKNINFKPNSQKIKMYTKVVQKMFVSLQCLKIEILKTRRKRYICYLHV